MSERYTTKKLLVLRKVTRGLTELIRGQLRDNLATLSPILRAKTVFGDYVQSQAKESVKGSEKAFKELQTLYESIAAVKPFNLPKELKAPIEIVSGSLEFTPTEYVYVAKGEDGEGKKVTVTAPLNWVLTYAGAAPARMHELLADPNRATADLQSLVLQFLVIHFVLQKQPGLLQVFEALHLPITTSKLPEFGELPITHIASSLTTIRPPDAVIIEATEIAGMDTFEEIVSFEDLAKMRDPWKERLVELVKTHDASLLAE